MNRRHFLKCTGSIAAGMITFPTITPSSVLGKNGTRAPSQKIALGCIGVGGRGRGNMMNLLRDSRCQVLAVCDVNSTNRNLARDAVNRHYKNQACQTYNDFRDIITRSDIDAVLICTPDHWHAILARAAAQAGKDIYCEKPLALTVTQGRALVDITRRYNIVFQTGTQQRSEPRFRRACELVRNGRIGNVHTVEVEVPGSMSCDGFYPSEVPPGFDYDRWLGPAPEAPYSPKRVHAFGWRWIFDYAGGCVTDWGAHHMDIAQWGLGTTHTGPIAVEGKGYFPKDGLFNTALYWRFECTYSHEVKVVCFAREEFKHQYPNGIKFIGTDGWLYVNRSSMDAHPRSILESKIAPEETHLYRSSNHYRNFIDCVISRRSPAAPVEEAHRSVSVCHLANIAMRLERKIQWDPQKEIIPGDEEANRLLTRPIRSPWNL
jgi:predicted dehydrogenase